MRTYKAEVTSGWDGARTLTVAAPSFLEAWRKVKALMRKRRHRYSILSIVQTATLDA